MPENVVVQTRHFLIDIRNWNIVNVPILTFITLAILQAYWVYIIASCFYYRSCTLHDRERNVLRS
jgi:hypothetical protein